MSGDTDTPPAPVHAPGYPLRPLHIPLGTPPAPTHQSGVLPAPSHPPGYPPRSQLISLRYHPQLHRTPQGTPQTLSPGVVPSSITSPWGYSQPPPSTSPAVSLHCSGGGGGSYPQGHPSFVPIPFQCVYVYGGGTWGHERGPNPDRGLRGSRVCGSFHSLGGGGGVRGLILAGCAPPPVTPVMQC